MNGKDQMKVLTLMKTLLLRCAKRMNLERVSEGQIEGPLSDTERDTQKKTFFCDVTSLLRELGSRECSS